MWEANLTCLDPAQAGGPVSQAQDMYIFLGEEQGTAALEIFNVASSLLVYTLAWAIVTLPKPSNTRKMETKKTPFDHVSISEQ